MVKPFGEKKSIYREAQRKEVLACNNKSMECELKTNAYEIEMCTRAIVIKLKEI